MEVSNLRPSVCKCVGVCVIRGCYVPCRTLVRPLTDSAANGNTPRQAADVSDYVSDSCKNDHFYQLRPGHAQVQQVISDHKSPYGTA